ncbi:MAG: hypothetical protein ABJL44_19325 [Algibacter sp.]
MKTKRPINPFCIAFGHNYFLKNDEATHRSEIFCKCCSKQFRYSPNGNIVEASSKQYALFPNLRHLHI